MITGEQAGEILQQLNLSARRGRPLRQEAMELLDNLPEYQWSGIYRLDGDELILDAYVGAETEHTHIPVGRGVCGTAVATNQNQLVKDVRELDNYLSCSVLTRSEIVVLIREPEGKVLGQIDIDGHVVDAFDATDEALLEQMGQILAARWND